MPLSFGGARRRIASSQKMPQAYSPPLRATRGASPSLAGSAHILHIYLVCIRTCADTLCKFCHPGGGAFPADSCALILNGKTQRRLGGPNTGPRAQGQHLEASLKSPLGTPGTWGAVHWPPQRAPGWPKALESATVEGASSSTRGDGWAARRLVAGLSPESAEPPRAIRRAQSKRGRRAWGLPRGDGTLLVLLVPCWRWQGGVLVPCRQRPSVEALDMVHVSALGPHHAARVALLVVLLADHACAYTLSSSRRSSGRG